MSANSSIDLTSLDFDSLKQSFKNYISSQEIFSDFDFEASNINLLLDILANNTFKNGFLLNMLMSEAFLDSAQLRNSVLSHAKELNYIPRSARSAIARIRVSFEATSENAPYTIVKGKPFTTLVKNKSYTFTNPETILATSTNTSFSFITDIYEGSFLQDAYTFLGGIENQTFPITNPNVDTRSLAVTVYEDNRDVGDTYRYSSTLLDIKSSSKVYFLQSSEDGTYEILFGDNNLGRRPKDNSIIQIEYRVASGPEANGAKKFSCDFDPTGRSELLSNITVDLLEIARDGAVEESIDSIKYYAPRHFQVQERAVTATDYEISLKVQFPEINAVHAFGGETLDPPQFGRVVVAVDVSNVTGLPDSKKKEYYNFIKRRSPFSIEPIFIESEFSYLSIFAKVRFNVNVTALSAETIESLVSAVIQDYHDENLNDFNSTLRFSKLATAIDSVDSSVVSSLMNISLYKKFQPTLGTRQSTELNFNVALRDDIPEKEKIHDINDVRTLYSSVFQYNGEQCIMEDDGSGIVRIMKIKGKNYEYMTNIGTVNYATGKVVISDILVDVYYGNAINIYVLPKDLDITVSQNTILTVESDEIEVDVEEIRI